MRSLRLDGQECLPFAEPERGGRHPAGPDGAGQAGPGSRRTARPRPVTPPPPSSYRLGAELVTTRGWPAGTEVVVDPALRPGRGDVVVVRERGRVSVGVFERRFGRAVLVSDRGVGWIGPQTEVLGVATVVGATLEGMPDPL